jgi:uncharacterized protein
MLGAQALVAAAREGQMTATELLLAENVDVNTPVPPFSVTPLWKASEHGHLDVVELLLAAGADCLAICRQKCALEPAQEKGHCEVVSRLKQAMGRGQEDQTRDLIVVGCTTKPHL